MTKKRVLIITYYWPPSGGGGVQRWLKMAKYLSEYGWEPIILTPKNPDFELQDKSLLKDVASETTVLKLPIWEPFGLYRKLMGKKAVQKQGVVDTKNESLLGRLSLWIRGNWFIPDARLFWVRPAANYAENYLRKNPVDIIITTGPPHSIHLIGKELKRRLGIKWIADFRDPWSDWDVLPQLSLTNKSWKRHRKLEHQVMHNADKVLTVTHNLAKQLELTGGIKKVEVVTNGFDTADFSFDESIKPVTFKIAHLGLLNAGRNPALLWEVLDELCAQNADFCEALEIVLAGTIDQPVRDSINSFARLKSKVSIPEYLAHKEVLTLYQESAVLLLLVNNTSNSSWILPGKLFEYFSARRPILAIGQLESEANYVLKECGYDSFLTYDDKEGLTRRVKSLFEAYKNRLAVKNSAVINKYDRKKLAGEVANLLNDTIA